MATRFSLPGDWSSILDRIQSALAHASRLAQEREDAQLVHLEKMQAGQHRQEFLDQLPDRLAELNRGMSKVAGEMARVDDALAHAESRHQAYLAAVNSLGG